MKLLLGLLSFICFSVMASSFIEGGRLATFEELESSGAVAIVYEKDGVETSTCTGVRIFPNLVLTAAHCVFSPLKFPKGIRQALNPLDKEVSLERVKALKFPFEDFYYRINFRPGYLLDVALLVLEKDSSESYPLISRPTENSEYIQLGYGMDFHYPTKEIFPLSILTNGVFDPDDQPSDFNFTLTNEKSSPRSGDSGGPVLMKTDNGLELAGVLSSGNPRPLDVIGNGRVIYMSAYHFIDWIRGLSGEESFNEHFEKLSGQYPREEKELITNENYKEVHKRLCRSLSAKLGSDWYLNTRGLCLPLDEELCMKMRRGEIGNNYFSVKWNSSLKRCEDI